MKTEDLKTQGLTDEQIAFVMAENGKDVKREKDKADGYKSQLDTAQEKLKNFEGKNFDTLTKERDDWKEKYSAAKLNYEEKLKEFDFGKALDDAVKDLKFTSESAKRAFMQDIRDKKLEVKDGKLTGFEDFLKTYKESDSKAFVDEIQQNLENNRARFTAPINNSGGDKQRDDTLRRAFGLEPRKD